MIIIASVLLFGSVDALRPLEPARAFHLKQHEVPVGIHDRRAEVLIGIEVLVVLRVGHRRDRDILRQRFNFAVFGDKVEHAAIDVELAFILLHFALSGFAAAERHLTGGVETVIGEKNRLDRRVFLQRNGKKAALPGIFRSTGGGCAAGLCVLCILRILGTLRLLGGSGPLAAAAGREAEHHDQEQRQRQNTDYRIIHSVLLAMIFILALRAGYRTGFSTPPGRKTDWK